MKFILLITFSLFLGNIVIAQDSTKKVEDIKKEKIVKDEGIIWQKVEVEAEFKGFAKFLEENLRYPRKAEKQNIQGIVTIQFVVDTEGYLSSIKLDENSPSKNTQLVNEAIRVIKLTSGKWTPGRQNGYKVKSWHLQSINFAIPK